MALDALECIHSGFPNQNIFHDSIPVFKKTSNGCYLIDDRSSRQLVTIKIVRNEFCHLNEELYFLDLRPPPLLGILFLPHEPIKTAAAITPKGSDLHRWQVRRSRTHIFRLHFEWLGIEVTWKILWIWKNISNNSIKLLTKNTTDPLFRFYAKTMQHRPQHPIIILFPYKIGIK